MLLGEILERSAQRYPEKTALTFQGTHLSYQQLNERVSKLVNVFYELGLQKGDAIGILMSNSIDFVISYYAIARLGGIIIPLNIMLKTEEVKYILNDAQAKALLTQPSYVKVVEQARNQLPNLQHILVTEEKRDNCLPLEELMNKHSAQCPQAEITCDDIVVYLYTSGTTGHPKGAMLTHNNLIANSKSTIEHIKAKESDCFMCVLPMFHTFAATVCLNVPIKLGATISILETFIPLNIMKIMNEDKVTIFTGVPSMYTVLVNMKMGEEMFCLPHLRMCISGGSSLPVEILNKVESKFGVKVAEGYGLSETSPVVTFNPVDGSRKAGSIGIAIPDVQVKIFDENDKELGIEKIGEIVVQGPNVMKGYYNMPEATAEALRSNWLHTGDIGKRDEDGFFYIVDRKKDLIIVGGLNVYPREVEEVLYTHQSVLEAAVIGVYDKLRGEAVKAVVVLKEGQEVTEKELIKYCRERLATYKIPRFIEFKDALPKTGTGKILKRALH